MARQTRAERTRKERAERRAAKISNYTPGSKRTQGENAGGPNYALRALHKQGLHNCGNPGCRVCFSELHKRFPSPKREGLRVRVGKAK
jgi:hypothetical protein